MRLAEKVLKMHEEVISNSELNRLETYLDKLFKSLNLDIEFTKHFLDRVNDERNVTQITLKELAKMFKEVFSKYGKQIAKLDDNSSGILKDMESDVNLPFVINYDYREKNIDLVAKTVMRKKNFLSNDKEYRVGNL